VNVNQAVVGIQGAAAGSGAGGGGPQGGEKPGGGGGDTGPTTTIAPDGTEIDTYDKGPGLETDVHGHNRTNIDKNDDYRCGGDVTANISGNNFTNIRGNDSYLASNQFSGVALTVESAVGLGLHSFEGNLLDVVAGAKLEFSGLIHVDLAILKANME